MSQIADVGALAFDRLLIVVQQAVDLFGQRLDLHRIAVGDAGGLALAHVGDLVPEAEQRTQTDLHLQEDGDDQSEAQDQQGGPGEGRELAGVVLDIGPVDRSHEHQRFAASRQRLQAGGDAQRLTQRRTQEAGIVEADRRARGGSQPGRQTARDGQLFPGQGGRAGDEAHAARAIQLSDGPVFSGQGPVGLGVPDLGHDDAVRPGIGRDHHLIDGVAQHVAEPSEGGFLILAGQGPAGEHEGQHDPGGGQPDQPAGQAATRAPEPAAPGPVVGRSRFAPRPFSHAPSDSPASGVRR